MSVCNCKKHVVFINDQIVYLFRNIMTCQRNNDTRITNPNYVPLCRIDIYINISFPPSNSGRLRLIIL